MTAREINDILLGDSGSWEGDNAFQGLQIIKKYTEHVVCGAAHDIIYSETVENLVKAKITKKDVLELRRLNWMYQDGCLACFV